MKYISLVVMLFFVTNILSGCGGGSSEASNVADGLVGITSDDSPRDGAPGVMLELEDGSSLYLLVKKDLPVDDLNIELFSVPDADMSSALNGTFYEFSSPNVGHVYGVLETDAEIISVTGCNIEDMTCTETPMIPVSSNSFAFNVYPEFKYAFDLAGSE